MKIFFDCGIKGVFDNGYELFSNGCLPYLGGYGRPSELIYGGLNQFLRKNNLRNPEAFDELYRKRDRGFMRFVDETIEICKKCDVVILSGGVDMLPPEILISELKKKIKLQYFVDDPHASLSYGTPYSFAFDGAIYISKRYSQKWSMIEFLEHVGFERNRIFWLPLCVSNVSSKNFTSHEDLIARAGAGYVGQYYGSKVSRLKYLKKKLGKDFQIRGRWPFRGLISLAASTPLQNNFVGLVPPLSLEGRDQFYNNLAVGFNLHQSFSPCIESGNVRTYELPWHGVAQVLDRPMVEEDDLPFIPSKEAFYYRDIEEAEKIIIMLLNEPELRAKVAYAGYKRSLRDYSWSAVLSKLFKNIDNSF